MHAVSGKALQSKVLGTTPRLDCNTSDTGEISNHIRVNAIILSNVIKRLFIVLNFLGIKAINSDREWS